MTGHTTDANAPLYDRLAEYKSTEKTADDGIQSFFFVILYFDVRQGCFCRPIMVCLCAHLYNSKEHSYIIRI